MARHGKGRDNSGGLSRPRILGRQDLLTRDDLEAMREEFGAGERNDGGLPLNLDDDLRSVQIAERVGLSPARWAEARGVPLAYGEALRRYLTQ